MLDQVLNTAKDIVVLDKAEDKVVFAFPFEGDIAKNYFNKTVVNTKENKVNGFNRHWEFDKKTGLIKGSSTFLTLRLDEEARKEGLWVPTLEQAISLDEKGKLSNNVYRDFGIAVYSDGNPNQEVVKEIIKQGVNLPLIIPFKALTHRLDENLSYGIGVTLTEDKVGIKSGKQATELLDKFNYKENSGACRLDRGWNGDWSADWGGLDISDAGGRVDWMCCEATRAELKEAYQGLIKRQYNTQIQKLTTKRDEKQEEFEKSLE